MDSAWDAGASSAQAFAGAGYVEATATEAGTGRTFALSRRDLGAGNLELGYAIYLASDGKLYVLEDGVQKGQFGPYATGDRFRIERLSDGHVIYKKNGSIIYTSLTVSTDELRVDTSFNNIGATLSHITMWTSSNGAAAVQWVNEVGVTQGQLAHDLKTALVDVNNDSRTDAVLSAADGRLWVRLGKADGTFDSVIGFGVGVDTFGGVLRKTGGENGVWDSGARSAESFSGVGYAEVTATETGLTRMFALSTTNMDAGYQSLNYGMLLNSNGYLYVYENGVQKGQFGA